MKPSKQIEQKLKDMIEKDADLRDAIEGKAEVDPIQLNSVTVASAVMIQAILDWLDEKFPTV